MKFLYKKCRNIFAKRISYFCILIMLIIVFSLLLFPMLYIAKWNVPAVDDFTNGIYVHDAILQGAGFFTVIKIAIERAVDVYRNWQGTFSGNFLFALQPSVFGMQYYIVVPYIMLFSLISGVCYFIIQLFDIFSVKKTHSFIISITILIACTQFLPSPAEGFYWYTGSVLYTFFFGLSLILYGLFIKLVNKKTKDKFVIISILCIIVAFSNYITALTTCILIISFQILLIAFGNKKVWKYTLIVSVIYCIAFYFNICAPGNAIRRNNYQENIGIINSIISSFKLAITKINAWNRLPILALYLFLCPLLWKIASESHYSFNKPWFLSLYSFCLFSSMFFPTIYTGSEASVGRIENIRFFSMIIMFIVNIFYWFGWLSKTKIVIINKEYHFVRISYIFGVIVLFLIGLINIPSYRITSYSIVQSYYLGQVGMYKHVFNQRMEILENPEIADAVLREYPRKKPFVLYFDDITQDINDWRNIDTSRYFHKNTVRLRTNEEIEASQNQ